METQILRGSVGYTRHTNNACPTGSCIGFMIKALISWITMTQILTHSMRVGIANSVTIRYASSFKAIILIENRRGVECICVSQVCTVISS